MFLTHQQRVKIINIGTNCSMIDSYWSEYSQINLKFKFLLRWLWLTNDKILHTIVSEKSISLVWWRLSAWCWLSSGVTASWDIWMGRGRRSRDREHVFSCCRSSDQWVWTKHSLVYPGGYILPFCLLPLPPLCLLLSAPLHYRRSIHCQRATWTVMFPLADHLFFMI